MTKNPGTLALVGGGEFSEECKPVNAQLLQASSIREVVVLPTASAFESPQAVISKAVAHFESLGARVVPLMVLNRRDAEDEHFLKVAKSAKFIYIADGSPLHLRSVLKGSSLFSAIEHAYLSATTLAASGAGATLLGDPMVDPRGGAYTVGLGLAANLAVFPYHGATAEHMRDRSVDLLPNGATLAGLDENTALVRDPDGKWRVAGPGSVTLYRRDTEPSRHHDSTLAVLNS